MIISKKVRLKPTPEQELQLWKSVGTARFIYNWTLNKQEQSYIAGNKFISDNDIRKELTQLKKTEMSWLKDVSNNVTKQAVKDCCIAYKNFFNKRANKPKFKSRKRSKKSFYNDTHKLKVKHKLVLIEKVGWIKTSEQLPIDCKYTNPRISYDNKYWYISVGIEVAKQTHTLTNISLGIDLGLKDFAVCSNGDVYKNISKTTKRIEKRLKRWQRQVSRKYDKNKKRKEFVKTKNVIKLEKRVQRMHRKLSNIRNNHLHQTTNGIVKTKPYRIVIEDLNVKGMMKNKHLSKAVANQGFHTFRMFLTYKCELNGVELVIADRWFPSSKTCSRCGKIKHDLKLKDRIYHCDCGLSIDRDLNASLNLSKYQLA